MIQRSDSGEGRAWVFESRFLGGGTSPEHDVSLVSASQVCNALRSRGHEVVPAWVAPGGTWHLVNDDRRPWCGDRLRGEGRHAPARHAFEALAALRRRKVDLVFPALHGRFGEDGRVQALLEAAGLVHVGSRHSASALGMSKRRSRSCFVGVGIPMAPAFVPTPREARELSAEAVARRVEELGLQYPLFLKEDSCGSSLGVERIDKAEDLDGALDRSRQLGPEWVLEEGVEGIELTCAVLGNCGSDLRALPAVEIRPRKRRFFDYAAKYDANETDELCPAPSLDPDLAAETARLAIAAHEALGCSGLSRTDMMLGGRELRVLETNTMPGLTPESLLPKAAAAGGLDFGQLCEELCRLALIEDSGPREIPRPSHVNSEELRASRQASRTRGERGEKLHEASN